jgi:hypothetical protein
MSMPVRKNMSMMPKSVKRFSDNVMRKNKGHA